VLEIERVWLLAAIDVGSRAILGYTLCLRREYSRYDVIRTFEKALTPAVPPTNTIADLELLQSGGFVSTTFPETAYACWRTIRFDNARAHLAADSLDVACELLGCTVDVGPAYDPNDRPFIERFFGTVAVRLIHRLPGTTGSNSDDILRKLRDVRGDLRLIVSLDELKGTARGVGMELQRLTPRRAARRPDPLGVHSPGCARTATHAEACAA
jgi:transposase InsO family protein